MGALSFPTFAMLKGLLATLATLLTYQALMRRQARLPRPTATPKREHFPGEPTSDSARPRDPAASQLDDGDDWHGRTPQIRQRRREAAAVARQLHHVRAMRSN